MDKQYLDGKLVYNSKIYDLHGKFKQYYGNGRIKTYGYYTNGKRDGIFFKFYDDGNLKAIDFYKNDKIHGECIVYTKSSEIFVENYKNGLKDGIVKLYINNKVCIGYNFNNKAVGEFKTYIEGKLVRIEIYKNNYLIKDISYYKSGELESIKTVRSRYLHGECIFYDKDTGLISEIINYRNGTMHGPYKCYKNGCLDFIKYYDSYIYTIDYSCENYDINFLFE
jgi:antitoxin component YwqK of YwqJK toxin-antitoxin module